MAIAVVVPVATVAAHTFPAVETTAMEAVGLEISPAGVRPLRTALGIGTSLGQIGGLMWSFHGLVNDVEVAMQLHDVKRAVLSSMLSDASAEIVVSGTSTEADSDSGRLVELQQFLGIIHGMRVKVRAAGPAPATVAMAAEMLMSDAVFWDGVVDVLAQEEPTNNPVTSVAVDSTTTTSDVPTGGWASLPASTSLPASASLIAAKSPHCSAIAAFIPMASSSTPPLIDDSSEHEAASSGDDSLAAGLPDNASLAAGLPDNPSLAASSPHTKLVTVSQEWVTWRCFVANVGFQRAVRALAMGELCMKVDPESPKETLFLLQVHNTINPITGSSSSSSSPGKGKGKDKGNGEI